MKLGLVGRNINYSLSKNMHEYFGVQANIDVNYELVDLDNLDNIKKIISEYDGLNVTIPYKEKIIPYLDELDPIAKKIGAVNTIIKKNGKIIGCNTDYYGILKCIKKHIDINNKPKKALIIGAGGAAKACFYALEHLNIETFIVNRTKENALEITKNSLEKDEVKKSASCFDILINATPIGMCDNEMPLKFKELKSGCLVIDLIYIHKRTTLLKEAEKMDATCVNGLEMLVYQGLKAFEIFTSQTLNDEKMLDFFQKRT